MAFESDWAFVRAANPDLRDYLLSSDLYWPLRLPKRLPGGSQVPQLTIGNLALSLTRLSGLSLSEEHRAELVEISQKVEAVRSEWRANWGLKAEREFGSRLNLWQQYIRELRADTSRHGAFYPNEVRMRVILHLLRTEIADPVKASDEEMLTMLDQILRGLTKTGSFVWEPEIADSFPRNPFWYLYLEFPG